MLPLIIVFGVLVLFTVVFTQTRRYGYQRSGMVVAPPSYNFPILLIAALSIAVGVLIAENTNIFQPEEIKEEAVKKSGKEHIEETKEEVAPPTKNHNVSPKENHASNYESSNPNKVTVENYQEGFEEESYKSVPGSQVNEDSFFLNYEYAIVLANGLTENQSYSIQRRYSSRDIEILLVDNRFYLVVMLFENYTDALEEFHHWDRHREKIKKHEVFPELVEFQEWVKETY